MEHGSLWRHGAYLGLDYTAEYLHRLAEIAGYREAVGLSDQPCLVAPETLLTGSEVVVRVGRSLFPGSDGRSMKLSSVRRHESRLCLR